MSNGYRLSRSYKLQYYASKIKQLSLFVDNMSPQRERGRPKRVLMDEEAASAPYAPPPQDDPQAPLEFLIPPMP